MISVAPGASMERPLYTYTNMSIVESMVSWNRVFHLGKDLSMGIRKYENARMRECEKMKTLKSGDSIVRAYGCLGIQAQIHVVCR